MSKTNSRSTGFQPVPKPNTGKMPVLQDAECVTGKMPVLQDAECVTGKMPVLQPFDPEADFDVRSRNLPHWRQEGATYFATFRLGDSLPREKLDALRAEREDWLRRHPPPRSATLLQPFQALFSAHIEEFLSAGWAHGHWPKTRA